MPPERRRSELSPAERFQEARKNLMPLVKEEILLAEENSFKMVMFPGGDINFIDSNFILDEDAPSHPVSPNEGDIKEQWRAVAVRFYSAFYPSDKEGNYKLLNDAQIAERIIGVLTEARAKLFPPQPKLKFPLP